MPVKDTLNWREFITRPALQKKKKKSERSEKDGGGKYSEH